MSHIATKRHSRLLLLAALLAPAAARANGFALDIQGVFSNGTASAGAASAHDPAGMYANPAVLASLEGTQVVVGGMVIAAKAPFTDGGSTVIATPLATVPVTGSNRDGAGAGVAPWVFASHRLSPELAVGLSFTAPFGTATDYGRDNLFYGRYQGVESKIESIAFGPAVAWRPLDKLAVGVGVSARRDSAVLGQSFDLFSTCVGTTVEQAVAQGQDPVAAFAAASDTCGTAGLGLAPGAVDGYGRFSATGWAWTATVGATFEPAPGTTLGVGYRHEAESKVKGHESFNANMGILGLTGEPKASMKLPLPDFLTVSASHQLTQSVQLLAAFQYTFWGRFDTLHLVADDPAAGFSTDQKQGYRNAFRASGAVDWTVRPGVEVFGGIAFEQSPITTKYRQVTLPERDSGIAGIGVQAEVARGVTVGAVYQRVQMLGTSKIDQPGMLGGLAGDRVVGSVKGSANVGALQIGWKG